MDANIAAYEANGGISLERRFGGQTLHRFTAKKGLSAKAIDQPRPSGHCNMSIADSQKPVGGRRGAQSSFARQDAVSES
jgi:hypothetical protein